MKCVVYSVAAWAGNDKIAAAIMRSDAIRAETLKRCYALPGYEALPLAQKNKVYEYIREQVAEEVL